MTDIPNYECLNCNNHYIPYAKDFSCPFCGVPSKESFDLIPEIVDSMVFHKIEYGYFSPAARYSGSLSDHIQGIVFAMLDELEEYLKEYSDTDREKYLPEMLDKNISEGENQEPEDQIFMKYMKGIIILCYRKYKEDAENVINDDVDLETPAFIRNKMKEAK